MTGMKTQIASANAAVKTALTDHAGDLEAALLQIAKVEAVTQTSLRARPRQSPRGTTLWTHWFIRSQRSDHQRVRTGRYSSLVSATAPGRGQSGVSSIYSDAYTDVDTNLAVSAGAITDTVIVTDSGDTRRRSPVRTASDHHARHARRFGYERAACECLALEAGR